MKFLLLALLVAGAASEEVSGLCDPTKQKTNATQINVAEVIEEAIKNELCRSHYPDVVGLVALGFGIFMFYDGCEFWKRAVQIAVCVFSGILAKQSVLSYWSSESPPAQSYKLPTHLMANIVAVEVGVIVFWAAEAGFKGIMAVIGAAGGFFLAQTVEDLMVVHVSTKFGDAEVEIVWYTLIIAGTVFCVHRKHHEKLLAIIAPFVGGVFMSSGLLFFITEAMVKSGCNWETPCNGLKPVRGQWFAFFLLAFQYLFSEKKDVDVGIFANNTRFNYQRTDKDGGTVYTDHIFILFFWFVFWGIGYKIQSKNLQKRKVTAREPLTESLLQVEEA